MIPNCSRSHDLLFNLTCASLVEKGFHLIVNTLKQPQYTSCFGERGCCARFTLMCMNCPKCDKTEINTGILYL